MCLRLDVPVLCGSLVRLEPLALSHASDLALAAEEDRSSYRFTTVPRAADVPEAIEVGWTWLAGSAGMRFGWQKETGRLLSWISPRSRSANSNKKRNS